MGASRPLLITIIGALYALLGIVLLALGALAFAGGAASGETALGAAGGGAIAVFGLIYIVIALGFFKGWKLWWYLGVIFAILGIIGGLIMFPVGLITVIIELIILWYLFRDNVKAFFFD